MGTYRDERFPFPSPRRLKDELRLRRPPVWMLLLLALVVVLTWVPLAIVYRVRTTLSDQPRVHLIQDMDVQPRFGPQAPSSLFADGRAMRPPVPGTVARGQASEDDHLHRGYTVVANADTGAAELQFFETLPPTIDLTPGFLERGRVMYGVHCALCHGDDGRGDGPVNQAADRLGEARWVRPTSILSDTVHQRPAGHLYNTIRNGIRTMPAHGGQIQTVDRWAIVAHVRAMQQAAPVEPEMHDE